MYEVTVDDLMSAFMHIKNYKSWLKGESIGKGLDSTPLKLKYSLEIVLWRVWSCLGPPRIGWAWP